MNLLDFPPRRPRIHQMARRRVREVVYRKSLIPALATVPLERAAGFLVTVPTPATARLMGRVHLDEAWRPLHSSLSTPGKSGFLR